MDGDGGPGTRPTKVIRLVFLYSLSTAGRKKIISDMHEQIKVSGDVKFEGLNLNTCANRSSIMSITQYIAYCDGFRLPLATDTGTTRTSIGDGGRQDTIGTETI